MILSKRLLRRQALRGLQRDPWLFIYCCLTVLGLLWLCDRYDPPLQAGTSGQGAALGDCRAGYVVDGDTIEIICGGDRDRARLIGLDTPELSKPQCPSEKRAAEAAKQALRQLIAKADRVEIELRGKDKYRRRLIYLWLDGKDAALTMIAAGHARPYDGGKRRGWCR